MTKKTLWVLLSLCLLFALQAGARVYTATNHQEPQYVERENPLVPRSGVNGSDAVDSTLFFEDFENGMNGWTTVDVTAAGVKWHIDDFNGYSGTNSWWCADTVLMGYDNHWLQYLVSPTLNFTGVTNPVLTFNMYYAVESPGGEPTGYDGWDGCNVWASINGGATWQVITPTTPTYNCTSLYSFGFEWGMGTGIAGWGGSSGGWVNASFNLAAAAGRPNVKIRFAMCSDPAYCTLDDPSLYGFFVDNVLIQDGATTLLQNNADGTAIPSEFTFDTGVSSGDFWEMTTASVHSPTHAMLNNHEGHYNLSDALVSPWLDIPEGVHTVFSFWLWCNMLDWDGNGDNYLEDYYFTEVSTDGANWTQVFYDYGDPTRPGGASLGWQQYLPGMPFNGNIAMDLTAYGGQQIKLRFRVVTDADDDGGVGTGLHIDDFELYTTGLAHDVGAAKLWVPMPTTAYFDTIPCSVELHNYGTSDEPMVPAFWRVNSGTANPLFPWASIPFNQMVLKEFDWVTPNPGSYFFDSYTTLNSDENLLNDTSKAGLVELTAANIFEFGYDNRQYSYEASIFYFNFDPGEGAYIKYTPVADGIDIPMNGVNLKAMFQLAGPIRVHIFEPGTASAPGPEVTQFDQNVTSVFPSWQLINIANVPFLQNTMSDFWVWYEETSTSSAPIMGMDEIVHGQGHFFANFNGPIDPSDFDFFARAIFQPATGVNEQPGVAQPAVFALAQNTPNPFNPATSISFSLEKAGMARLAVYDLLGREICVLAEGSYSAGQHTIEFNAADLSSGVYVYRLEADGKSLQNKMLLLK